MVEKSFYGILKIISHPPQIRKKNGFLNTNFGYFHQNFTKSQI